MSVAAKMVRIEIFKTSVVNSIVYFGNGSRQSTAFDKQKRGYGR